MKTKVENISDVKVLLTISLDKEDLANAEQVALTKLAKDVKVSGFRKGKAPLEVVAKNIDPVKLNEQLMEDAVSKSVAEAFLKEEIKALARPEVEIKKYVPGSELEFTAETEILPAVKLGDYKKLKAKKEKVTVNDKEVTETIERIQKNFATKETVDRKAKKGDEVIIDFLGKKDDKPFDGGKAEKFPLELGSNSFIPGFEDSIIGKKAGEEFALDLEFPKEYHVKELAGQKVVFEVKLHEVKENSLPELTDEFVKEKFSEEFKNLEEFKKQIKEDLLTQKTQQADEKFKDELVRELAEKSEIPVPSVLLQDQQSHIEMDMQRNLMYSGLSLDQYLERMGKTREQWLEEEVKKVAEERVKAGLALAELSKVEKIESDLAEVEKRLEQLKAQYGSNKEALKQLESEDIKRDIANQILTEKAVDRLVELNSK